MIGEIDMSTLKDLYEIIKDLGGLAKKHNDNAMAEKVIDIQARLFEVREQIEEVKEENRQLKEKIKELESSAELEKDLELVGGTYIRLSEKEEGKNHFYCAACWQNFKKLYPVVETIGTRQQCTNCHTVIG